MMQYRSPTRHDIGKTVEVYTQSDGWLSGELTNLRYDKDSTFVCVDCPGRSLIWHSRCRVPYTTADPITELSITADLLAENGMDEAARVCLAEIERYRDNQRMQESVHRMITEGLGVLDVEN